MPSVPSARQALAAALLCLPLPDLAAETVSDARITEFLANNQEGIEDGDGDRSDWIEIWNASGVAGDLAGWYLSDDPADLTKWTIPAVDIGSSGYLIIFASGKDRTDPAADLHTNFRIQSEANGFLALVRPDGVTVASQFQNYPEQFPDIAYGSGFESAVDVTLIDTGAQGRWTIPDATIPAWTSPGFDDSSWSSGSSGFGYDNIGGDYSPLFGSGDDFRGAMRTVNTSAYIRIPFQVPDPAGITDLTLSLQWEDGFIAYLNGTEIHRERAPDTPAWNSTSNPASGRNENQSILFSDYPITTGGLIAGTNVLAIHGLNDAAGSSDFLISPRLTGSQQNITNLVDGFFPDPTPGDENLMRYDGITADTKFSVDRGLHESAFDLAITTATPGATIRYTTNGTPPTETTGDVYTGPISIDRTTVIRALAFAQGFRPTNVDTHSYIFPSDVVTQPAMRTAITEDPEYGPKMIEALTSIPTLSISFVGNNINYAPTNPPPGSPPETPVSVEMLNFESGAKQVDAGAERFGGEYTQFAKRSLRLHFRSIYGPKRLNYPLFDGHDYSGIPPVSDFDALDVRAGNHDMVARGAYMSNRFADDSLLDMGHVAPHGRFVHVYFNGEYRGQYHLRERWAAAMLASYLPGSEEEFDTITGKNSGDQFQTGDSQNGDLTDWREIQTRLAGPSPYKSTRDFIDVPDYIDFMLLWTSGNSESEFRAGGSIENGVPYQFMIKDGDGHLRPPGHAVTHNGPLNAMSRYRNEGDPDYKILLADQIHKHFFNGGAMTGPALVERLQRRVDEVRLSYIAEVARWGTHNGQTNRNPVQWQAYQESLLNGTLKNLAETQLAKYRSSGMYPDVIAPVLSQHGGSIPAGAGITMSTGATAIYYTLDGSDPRQPGGAIDPAATRAPFEGDVPEPQDFIITGDNWRFLDDGSDRGSAWRSSSFDDSSWAGGPSPLGYNEDYQATTVGYVDAAPEIAGLQRNATTYFRRKVNIAAPASFSFFHLNLKYDDAAAVYINGNEVERTTNLPAEAAFDTYATSQIPSRDEDRAFLSVIPTTHFVDGENTIAVEVHNGSAGSSDINFDLTLRGEIDTSNGNNVTQPIILDAAAELNARAYNSATGEWSALTSTFFSINSTPATANNLAISEIHYHPAEPTSPAELAISTDRDDYEFIELLNLGEQPIDLTGVHFSAGIHFAFAQHSLLDPGARAVLVRDAAAFAERYGAGVQIAGEFSGRLSNGGEQLTLSLTGIGDLRDLSYSDQIPWPTLPDGGGYSLVLRTPAANPDHALPGSWGTHSVIGGAPGAPDSVQAGGFDAWKVANQILDDAQDDDNDNIPAIIEYALGTSPTLPSNNALPVPGVISIGDEHYQTISYERNPDASDIRIQLQSSTDLVSWEDQDAIEVTPGTYRTSTAIVPGARQYLRLEISR